MKLKSFIKDNKVFSAITIVFVLWIALLIILSILFQREVVFYDALAQKDVSKEYQAKIPIYRYFIEPLIGYTLIIAPNTDWIIGYILIFIIIRLIYYFYRRKGNSIPEKVKLLWYPIKDFIRFAAITIGISLLICLAIILIMFFGFGFLYVNLYWMLIIQLLLVIDSVLLVLKLGTILFKGWHPYIRFEYSQKKRAIEPENKIKAFIIQRGIRREASYLFGIALLIIITNAILISTRFPVQEIKADLDENEYLFDFHVHTIMSDGWLTPEERVLWYIEHGVKGAAFSDHDNIRGGKAAREFVKRYNLDFVVIIAEEWTDHGNDIHMNLFGIKESLVPLESKTPGGPKAMNAEDVIKYVKEQGGYVIVNHYNYNPNPNGGFGTPYTLEQLREWGVDGFEIVNGGGIRNLKIREFCLNNSLICISASDTHTNEELNSFIKLKIEDSEINVDTIFKNLKKNEHEAVAVDYYPKQVEFPEYINSVLDDLGFNFLDNVIEYFINLNLYQYISWICWSFGGFIILSIIYKKIKKLNLNELRNKLE
ncbi:MAG: PHP domain-containing protein [Promethearchaeota archaeon]